MKRVKLIPGSRPNTWTVATAFLGNPVGDAILGAMPRQHGCPGTTRDLPEREALAVAQRVERYLGSMEK